MTATAGPWLEHADDLDCAVRLFCLPYAGGGPRVFREWSGAADGFAVATLCLPGRERRFGETPPGSLEELIDELAGALEPYLDRPYALFGHSAGARFAFELARRLCRTGRPDPVALFVSGARPPHRQREFDLHDLPDPVLGRWLMELGGMPPSVLTDPDLAAAMLPVLRADLRLISAPYLAGEPLCCPIRGYAGTHDPEVGLGLAGEWDRHTTGGFSLRSFPGGHFFLRRHRTEILADIAGRLTPNHLDPSPYGG